MYHTAELRRFQYYVNPTWSGGHISPLSSRSNPNNFAGGVYASPSLSGSRYDNFESSTRSNDILTFSYEVLALSSQELGL
jgi:hypothetical protein